MDGLLDCDDGIACGLEGRHCFQRVAGVLPGDAVLGAEGGLVNLGGRGHGADAAEPDLVGLEGVSRAEGGADVVRTPYVVQHDHQPGLGERTVLLSADAAEFYVQ